MKGAQVAQHHLRSSRLLTIAGFSPRCLACARITTGRGSGLLSHATEPTLAADGSTPSATQESKPPDLQVLLVNYQYL